MQNGVCVLDRGTGRGGERELAADWTSSSSAPLSSQYGEDMETPLSAEAECFCSQSEDDEGVSE